MSGPEFFFGAMSPYSWLAAERIEALVPAARWRPVVAGAIFKAHGRVSWGLTSRRADGMADCERRARAHGLGPIVWPDPWPTRDLLVARAMVYADTLGRLRDFALCAMRTAFVEGRDLEDPAAVQRAAAGAGLDPRAVADACSDPEVKHGLRSATQRALDLGVYGVPTVAVDGRLYWGDDRLEEAAAAARAPGR